MTRPSLLTTWAPHKISQISLRALPDLWILLQTIEVTLLSHLKVASYKEFCALNSTLFPASLLRPGGSAHYSFLQLCLLLSILSTSVFFSQTGFFGVQANDHMGNLAPKSTVEGAQLSHGAGPKEVRVPSVRGESREWAHVSTCGPETAHL